MSKPIYMLVIGKGWTEAYWALSEAEREDLTSKVAAISAEAGEEWVILCNSRWADEEIFDWGVLKYPDMDAYLRKVERLEEIQWWRYFAAKTILGTEMEFAS